MWGQVGRVGLRGRVEEETWWGEVVEGDAMNRVSTGNEKPRLRTASGV